MRANVAASTCRSSKQTQQCSLLVVVKVVVGLGGGGLEPRLFPCPTEELVDEVELFFFAVTVLDFKALVFASIPVAAWHWGEGFRTPANVIFFQKVKGSLKGTHSRVSSQTK